MKRLTSSEIKQTLLGVILSDGYIDRHGRFEIYQKREQYLTFILNVLNQLSGIKVKQYPNKLCVNAHPYFRHVKSMCYHDRKFLSSTVVKKLTSVSIANMWMCDGYLEHPKNRNTNKCQNIGWFCLEAFPKEELNLLISRLHLKFGIKTRLVKKPWGFGYRIKISGLHLQRFISLVYPHILDCFRYKTKLYYKTAQYVDWSLSNAGQFCYQYNNIEDIVHRNNLCQNLEPVC